MPTLPSYGLASFALYHAAQAVITSGVMADADPILGSCGVPLLCCEHADAATFSCSPAPIETGTIRSSASEERSITVALPNALPYWFDDATRDYLACEIEGGEVHPKRIDLLLAFPKSPRDRLRTWVTITFAADQCVEAVFDVLPALLQN